MTTDLFKRWKEKDLHKGNGNFIEDGIIDLDKWEKCDIRVLFILREAYQLDPQRGGFDLRKFIRNGVKGNMWKVGQWAYLLQNYKDGAFPNFPGGTDPKVEKALLSSAIINIKKSGGNKSTDMAEIKIFAKNDKELLLEQIEKINPDVIVCGSVFEIIEHFWDNLEQVSPRVYKSSDLLIIDFWHPATRWHNHLFYYGLAGLLQALQAANKQSNDEQSHNFD